MVNRDKLASIAILAGLVALMAIIGLLEGNNRVLKNENAALKREIAEWQNASMRAVRARGWEGMQGAKTAAELKPEVLEFAFDRCFLTPAGNYTHSGSDCLDIESKDRQPPPARIVFYAN